MRKWTVPCLREESEVVPFTDAKVLGLIQLKSSFNSTVFDTTVNFDFHTTVFAKNCETGVLLRSSTSNKHMYCT